MKRITLIVSLLLSSIGFLSAQNENGGVRISFGSDMENVEPRTLSGDDPSVPAKPKRQFFTNSITLNKILSDCDDYETLKKTLDQLQESSIVTVTMNANGTDCFTIVYNSSEKKVVAVLDKGKGKRMNLLNNQFETEDAYQGESYEKIYFSIEE
ncbi:MAG: hypothetical protein J5642_00140 [Bacteroidales bacterium]|nr:hypothetical protein [Bacteroidales bacterium]